MSEILKFATAVIYADDVAATVAFYRRVTGLEPTYYDADLGFALLGEDQAVAIASHDAGMLMLADGYGHARSNRVRGTELAFWTRDVAAAFQVAVEALSDSFEMFQSAERVLLEFGGLGVDQRGPGQMCAREPFTLDPTLAAYEGDRFSQFSTLLNTRLYPLGEAAGGYYFLAVGENDHVYLVMEDIRLLGEDMDAALEGLLIGLEPKEIE